MSVSYRPFSVAFLGSMPVLVAEKHFEDTVNLEITKKPKRRFFQSGLFYSMDLTNSTDSGLVLYFSFLFRFFYYFKGPFFRDFKTFGYCFYWDSFVVKID